MGTLAVRAVAISAGTATAVARTVATAEPAAGRRGTRRGRRSCHGRRSRHGLPNCHGRRSRHGLPSCHGLRAATVAVAATITEAATITGAATVTGGAAGAVAAEAAGTALVTATGAAGPVISEVLTVTARAAWYPRSSRRPPRSEESPPRSRSRWKSPAAVVAITASIPVLPESALRVPPRYPPESPRARHLGGIRRGHRPRAATIPIALAVSAAVTARVATTVAVSAAGRTTIPIALAVSATWSSVTVPVPVAALAHPGSHPRVRSPPEYPPYAVTTRKPPLTRSHRPGSPGGSPRPHPGSPPSRDHRNGNHHGHRRKPPSRESPPGIHRNGARHRASPLGNHRAGRRPGSHRGGHRPVAALRVATAETTGHGQSPAPERPDGSRRRRGHRRKPPSRGHGTRRGRCGDSHRRGRSRRAGNAGRRPADVHFGRPAGFHRRSPCPRRGRRRHASRCAGRRLAVAVTTAAVRAVVSRWLEPPSCGPVVTVNPSYTAGPRDGAHPGIPSY